MLSYQHSYHAGNFADVHKHLALLLLLRCLQRKESPLCYIDSHAGRGLYDLAGVEARKTCDAETGILRLLGVTDAPEAVRDYLDLVASFNRDASLRFYPGSAALAQAVLREQDRAILLELHRQEYAVLRDLMIGDRRIATHARDCYEGLPALLPPAIRRGVVLIDPSYEVKSEYEDIVKLLDRAIRRWPNGVYALWYPILASSAHERLLDALGERTFPKMLSSEICISGKAEGLEGSGLIIINTPWQFDERLADALEYVIQRLRPAGQISQALRWLTAP